MSGLSDHKTLTGATDVTSGLRGTQLRDRMNDNYDALLAAAQGVEDRLEDIAYEAFGSGVLSGMVPSAGSGLNIDVTAGYALIGHVVDYAGGSASVEASQTDASLYFAQDGNFYTSAPTGQPYFTLCTYSSDGSSVTSVSTKTSVLPCTVETITDTFEDVTVDSSHTLDYEIDHSATTTFQIPGFITVSVSPSNAFDIEHIDMEDDTGDTFTVRVTRKDAYQSYEYYAEGEEYETVDITFTRTGLSFA